jgi:glycosyltransferase involved in cell wall biosynthesis
MSVGASSYRELPLITVGVTTYDRPELLKECIGSILAQTYQNFEIIIGNDFVQSPVSFESLSIDRDKRIHIINHPENIGAYKNNHFLLAAANGDWFTWLADDDLMHPDFLEIAYGVFSVNAVNAVFSNYVAAVSPAGVFPKPVQSQPVRLLRSPEFIDEYTFRTIRTVGSYGVFRRDLFEQFSRVKRFGVGLPVYGDTFIPILAASLGAVAYVDLDLVFLRTHAGSRSASSARLEDYSSAQRDFMSEFETRCRGFLTRQAHQRQVRNMVKWFAADGWHVVCRGHLGVIRRLTTFFQYAIDTLLPMARDGQKLVLVMYMSKMVFGDSLRYLAASLLRRLKLMF